MFYKDKRSRFVQMACPRSAPDSASSRDFGARRFDVWITTRPTNRHGDSLNAGTRYLAPQLHNGHSNDLYDELEILMTAYYGEVTVQGKPQNYQ